MTLKLFGIEFVDILTTPLHRRLQTLSVLQWFCTFIFLGFTGAVIFFKLLFSPYYYLSLLYAAWYVYDFGTCENGGRPVAWVRRMKIWTYFRDYFPVKLVKTADLELGKNYIFLYHPHGIFGCGAFLNFATDANSPSELFKGFNFRLLILRIHFYLPLAREYGMSFGSCPASKKSIHSLLSKCGTNNILVLVVGGAHEALEANSGNFNLYLNNRKGIFKLALQHGTSLVPVYSYGESDLYSQIMPSNAFVRNLQHFLTKYLTFSIPFFHGRGVFNYTFGFMPYRKPVTTVVGSPIEVVKIENPTDEEINSCQKKYIDHLINHFEQHKLQYGLKEDDHLNII